MARIFIVMEFVEHDLKTLLSSMRTPFLQSEIKTLMRQLLSALALLHANWIIHRDLKTSNLLLSNRGTIKLADFGLARMYGDPLGEMTPLVVTLWYRAPELLLGATEYTEAIDLWSVGCIFAELINKEPLLPGKNESDQIRRIFKALGGPPTPQIWPGCQSLPNYKAAVHHVQDPPDTRASLRSKFKFMTDNGIDLLARFLTYDPSKRISAAEALQHPYFHESPAPAHPDSYGSFPSIAACERRRDPSPDAPKRPANHNSAYQLEFDL